MSLKSLLWFNPPSFPSFLSFHLKYEPNQVPKKVGIVEIFLFTSFASVIQLSHSFHDTHSSPHGYRFPPLPRSIAPAIDSATLSTDIITVPPLKNQIMPLIFSIFLTKISFHRGSLSGMVPNMYGNSKIMTSMSSPPILIQRSACSTRHLI
ncbi:hypothetical protein ES703_42901 [subsurface metagenome]